MAVRRTLIRATPVSIMYSASSIATARPGVGKAVGQFVAIQTSVKTASFNDLPASSWGRRVVRTLAIVLLTVAMATRGP